jgi:hypothetical protein
MKVISGYASETFQDRLPKMEDDCHLEPTAKDLCPGGAAKVSEILRFTQDAMISPDVWFSLKSKFLQ